MQRLMEKAGQMGFYVLLDSNFASVEHIARLYADGLFGETRVGDSVRGEYELLKASLGSGNCTLAWNPGNHFQDEDKRLAAAFSKSWQIKDQNSEKE